MNLYPKVEFRTHHKEWEVCAFMIARLSIQVVPRVLLKKSRPVLSSVLGAGFLYVLLAYLQSLLKS